MTETVEFAGEKFATAERIGLMPLMRFAKVAKVGADSESLEGLAAMYDLLEQCIDPGDWQRFQDHADSTRADADELMNVVKAVFELLTARPTSRPSDSSDGPQHTEPSSTSDSASKAALLFPGRPDLQIAVPGVREAS